MNSSTKLAFLPRALFRTLDVLEAWTDGAKPWRAMSMIVLVGLACTGLACAVLWNADRHRDQREFESLAQPLTAQMGDRLHHRLWHLSRASERWTHGEAPPSMAGAGFEPGQLLSLKRQGRNTDELMGWLHLGESSSATLEQFWQTDVARLSSMDESLMSPALTDIHGKPRWLLVHASKAQTPSGDPQG